MMYVAFTDGRRQGADKSIEERLVFIYGKWGPVLKEIVYNKEKQEILQSRSTDKMNHCSNCSAKEHCGGYCLGEVLNETKNLFGQKRGVCEAIRFLDRRMNDSQRKYSFTHP